MKTRILIKIGGRAFDGEDGFKQLAQAIKQNPEAEWSLLHAAGPDLPGLKAPAEDGLR